MLRILQRHLTVCMRCLRMHGPGFVLFMVLYGVNAFIMLSRHKVSSVVTAM